MGVQIAAGNHRPGDPETQDRGDAGAEKHCLLQEPWPHSVSQAVTVSRLQQPSAPGSTCRSLLVEGRRLSDAGAFLKCGVEWGWQLRPLLALLRLGEWEGVPRSRCAFPALRGSTCCLWACSFMPSMPADAFSNVSRMERLKPCRESDKPAFTWGG